MFEKNLPEVVSPQEWLAARKELLVKEKELTRARDRVNADRRRLPMARVDKPYTFEGPEGTVGLLDLFEGRPQLVMHHFMWINGIDGRSTSMSPDTKPRLSHTSGSRTLCVSFTPPCMLQPHRL